MNFTESSLTAIQLSFLVVLVAGCSTPSTGFEEDQSPGKTERSFNGEPESQDICDPNYEGSCVPVVSFDLDCPDITGPVVVVGMDIHGFDRDRDGTGREPYP